MATSPDLTSDPKSAAGLSRRSVLTRTATGLGITLTGSLGGLLGADAALGTHADDQGEARSRESEQVGYGPLEETEAIKGKPHDLRAELLARQADPVRERPVAGVRVRDPGPVPQAALSAVRRRRAHRGARRRRVS
jgi:hypothetical protein